MNRPILSYKSIGKIAEKFLLQVNPQIQLPIPIEEIAERELSLEIIPVKRLKLDFDFEGYLSKILLKSRVSSALTLSGSSLAADWIRGVSWSYSFRDLSIFKLLYSD
jgi:hypothetical protein